MVDAVLDALDMSVEHRRIALDAEAVCRAVHVEPLGRRPLVGTDARTDLLVEDLRPAARDGIHTGIDQQPQPLLRRQPALRIMYDSSMAVKALTAAPGRMAFTRRIMSQ